MDLNSIEIQIFVSCPSDVKNEKDLVSLICGRINKNLLHSKCNIHLVFRDFSEIIGHTGIRPQQLINDLITGNHFYLGILHMRFGSPTGAVNLHTGKEFESGTEEEFVIATDRRSTGKAPREIYFFFKNQNGSKSSIEHEQAGKVLRFKESLMPNNWVNSFDYEYEFERQVFDLLTRFTTTLCIDVRTGIKQAFIKDNLIKAIETEKDNVDLSLFALGLSDLPYYIPRSITQPQKSDIIQNVLFSNNKEQVHLKDLLLQETKIVLLGNAGSGKSVELQQTAKYFQIDDTPFIPIYKRLNTYTNENIEAFLPDGWNKVNPNILILLLDGLDEIQPQYFNIAVRKLIDFTERNPDIRIVVSSRTNFYELPSVTFSGTLTGFQVYILNDISLAETKNYATTNFYLNWDKFIEEAYTNSYLDLVQKPFFLNILIKYYMANGNFTVGRSKIIEDSIFSMIEFDKEHFKTSDILEGKKAIFSLLEKVAFIMEVMGKNFITDEELQTILPTQKEIEQIKHFSTFAKNIQKRVWMFEHNNIQEFLASSVLSRQSFENLIEIISFAPSHKKIKPTWVNTMSFFISTGEMSLVKKLVDWLIINEQDIVVKFEPDIVDRDTRILIFKKIFNSYKINNIWLSSNKFTHAELSRFAALPEIIDFLLSEIQDSSNSKTVRMNALFILDNFRLDEFDLAYKQKVKDVLTLALKNETSDTHLMHNLLYAFAKLNLNSLDTIEYAVNRFSKNINQYIRSGLYKLITKSVHTDQFIDIFMDGLNLNEINDPEGERDGVNLMDESWQLKEGLKNMKSPTSLRKILAHLKSREERRHLHRDDHSEVIESVLKNSFAAYKEDNIIYKDIYDIYLTAGRDYDHMYAKMILPFFEQTEKKWDTFISIWQDTDLVNYDKTMLLELLLDNNIIESFISHYRNRDFSNQDAQMMHQILMREFVPGHKEYSIVEQFEIKIHEISGLILERPVLTDWAAITKKKIQASFDLLFSKENMLKEIKAIFLKIGNAVLTFADLWQLRKDNFKELDDYFINSALELLRDFTSNDRTIQYAEIEEWITQSPAFLNYQIDEIYQHLHGSRQKQIEVSSKQLEFITQWCLETSSSFDIAHAIKYRSSDTPPSVDWPAIYLWFFIRHFHIALPENKMLDFTLFYDYESLNKPNLTETIRELEPFVAKEKIEIRVEENLTKKITNDYVWLSNSAYAITNNIKKSYPHILHDLKNSLIAEHYRTQILDLYFQKTGNIQSLQDILTGISADELRWKVVNHLLELPSQSAFLTEYLRNVMSSEYELLDSKMNAAKYLMALNDLDGLQFMAEQILRDQNPDFDFYLRLRTLSGVKQSAAIPILMDLLKLAIQPEFQKDKFNSLESAVFDALYNIGIQSEDSFILIKTNLEKFILENKETFPNLNFLHLTINKIEDQLYLNKSQSYSIQDAIKEYSKLSG